MGTSLSIQEHFLDFHLEDKVALEGEGIVRNPTNIIKDSTPRIV